MEKMYISSNTVISENDDLDLLPDSEKRATFITSLYSFRCAPTKIYYGMFFFK